MRHRRASWVAVLLLGLGVMGAAHVEAARSFNGTSDSLVSASPLTYGSPQKITVAFWFYQNAFIGSNGVGLESGIGASVGGYNIVPDHVVGEVRVSVTGGGGTNTRGFAKPTGAAWHHYVMTYDFDLGSNGAEVVALYIDGVLQTPSTSTGSGSAGPFNNLTLNAMSRNNASFFNAGRMAEIAIWTTINFTQTDVDSLYRDGLGALATSVQPGSLKFYWRILGDASPEPATVGGISLTVNGTSQVQHPFVDPPSPRSRAPRLPRQRPATR